MYGGRMFLDHLLAALRNPQSQLFQLDDELPLDVDRYRALLSAETWRRGRSGQLDESTVAWVFRCIADGWVDEHLSDIRDALLELLAIRDADHLDALLCLATQQIVGETDGSRSVADEEAPLLTAADHQLLRTTTSTVTGEQSHRIGLRLFARRYAIQLGLLSQKSGVWQRTCLGDAVLELPRMYAWPLLLSLESQQAMDPYDRWRVSKEALAEMRRRSGFVVRTSEAADASEREQARLFPWQRVRRMLRCGLVEALPLGSGDADEARCEFGFRLTQSAMEAAERVLRAPEHEVARLARSLMAERTDEAMQPYRHRQARSVDAPSQRLSIEHAVIEHALPSHLVMDRTESGEESASSRLLRVTDLWNEPSQVEGTRDAQSPSDPELVSDPVEPLRPASGGERGPQEIDLGPLIRRAWGDLQERRVHFSLLGPSAQVVGERRLLVQTLRELLRGAAASAQHGSHSLALVTVELAPQEDHVVLFVHDNGMGPPLPMLPSLLEMSDEELADADDPDSEQPSLQRIQQSLWTLGGELTLMAPRLGGTSLRIILPRSMQDERSAA